MSELTRELCIQNTSDCFSKFHLIFMMNALTTYILHDSYKTCCQCIFIMMSHEHNKHDYLRMDYANAMVFIVLDGLVSPTAASG